MTFDDVMDALRALDDATKLREADTALSPRTRQPNPRRIWPGSRPRPAPTGNCLDCAELHVPESRDHRNAAGGSTGTAIKVGETPDAVPLEWTVMPKSHKDEIPKRLKPSFATFRALFLKSGNLCAFPGCDALVMNEAGLFIGQLCHIEAAEPGGERFNPNMTNEERRSASNLMLMCYPHHRETNDKAKYTVADLRRMKAAHERRFSRPDRAMRERAARLNWGALIGAGVIAGMSIREVVHQIRSAFDALVRPSNDRTAKPSALRKDLEQGLRYAPIGTIYCYSRDPLHLAAGDLFLEIFERAGWRVERMDKPPRLEGEEKPDFDHSMLMIFEFKNTHQLPIGRQAIDELFQKCGFVSRRDHREAIPREGGWFITFYTPLVVRRR
jgi:hypothetical protein